MTHKIINTKNAPKAVGPYSQAIISQGSNLLFISGQIPLDPKNMLVISQDIRDQTIQVLKNLKAILEESKLNTSHVVKATIYLKNMDDFDIVNQEYASFFSEHLPARVCIEVARLPKDVLVEIDAIAAF